MERIIAGKLESTYVDRLWPFVEAKAKEMSDAARRESKRSRRDYSAGVVARDRMGASAA
ncbi:MAG: hypothetical protein ACR2LC_09535 [Pyrinomonadaceae bacterium]